MLQRHDNKQRTRYFDMAQAHAGVLRTPQAWRRRADYAAALRRCDAATPPLRYKR